MTASDRSSMNIPDELEAPKSTRKRVNHTYLDIADYVYPPPRPELVAGCLGQGSTTLLFGAPGGCKSAVAMQWAVHVAAGIPWLGHPVEQGRVLYILGEGVPEEVMKRFHAIAASIGADLDDVAENLVIALEPSFKLDDSETVNRFLNENKEDDGLPVDLIILDTWVQFNTGDNNSSQDAMAAHDGIKAIKQSEHFKDGQHDRPPTVLAVMHEAKISSTSSTSTPQGSVSLLGFCDRALRMYVEKDAQRGVVGYVLQRDVKNRDSAAHDDIHLVVNGGVKFSHTAISEDGYEYVHQLEGFAMKLKDTQMPGAVRDAFNWYLDQYEANGDERPTNKQLEVQARADKESGWGGSAGPSRQFGKFKKYNLVDDDDAPLVERLPQSDSVDQQVLDLWGTSTVGEEDA